MQIPLTPTTHPQGPRHRESGNALAAIYMTLVPVIGIIVAMHSRTNMEIQVHQDRKAEIRATQRCLAGLEVARNVVMRSAYNSSGNQTLIQTADQTSTGQLMAASDTNGGNGFVVFNTDTGLKENVASIAGLPDNLKPYKHLTTIDLEDDVSGEVGDDNDKVRVYAVRLTDTWHMIESKATIGRMTRTARMLVRERDPFTRFSIFIDSHYQGISGAPKGDIHTNRTLQLFFAGGVYDDYVSARDGFDYIVGSSAANTTYNAGSSPNSAEIAMPDINDIQNLQPLATGAFNISSQYDNVKVVFNGDNVKIEARNISTGGNLVLHDGAYPPGGVIYSENDIVSVEGDVNARLTLASEGSVTITNSIRYVDDEGDPARIDTTSPESYTTNPDYNGSSALGIIANDEVVYDHNIPDIFELHAAVFSATGTVGIPGLTFSSAGQWATGWDASFQKQNMFILGATISDKRYVGTVVNGSGTVLSGFQDGLIEYDRSLLNNPPPHFLEIDRPLFKGVEILENVVDS